MKAGIYGIRNILNGKIYVGSAVNLRKRLGQHRLMLRLGVHHSRHLQHAWVKYGEHGNSAFVFEVIEVVADKRELIAREQFHMDAGRAKGLYNTARTAGSLLGHRQTPEHRARISASHIGNTYALGFKHSKETCARRSAALTGKKLSLETRRKLAVANLGKKLSLEHRARISAGVLARGIRRKFSQEHRTKLSASKKRYYANKRRGGP